MLERMLWRKTVCLRRLGGTRRRRRAKSSAGRRGRQRSGSAGACARWPRPWASPRQPCCEGNSECQALERTQPGPSLGRGHIRTKTHDDTRHGTITLFAALAYLDGKIFAHTAPRHSHRQWLAFLRHLDAQTPPALTLHLIIDNYATHKHTKVKNWIAWRNARQRRAHNGRMRIVLHFTPTSSSWMNLIERFFRDCTEDAVREGSFASLAELVRAIESDLVEHNLAPERYLWKAQGRDILPKINQARDALGRARYMDFDAG